MKLKMVNYILLLLISLLLSGCGSSSSSKSQPNSRLSNQGEKVAIYISMEELEAQKSLSKATNTIPSFKKSSKLIKEDAERNNINSKWLIYDKNPIDTHINIRYDDIKESRVIEFHGNKLQNSFALGAWTNYGAWSNKTHKIIQWSMSYSEDYYVYVRVSTEKGYRYLYYTPSDNNYGITKLYDAPHYIHHGLGSNSTDGSWKTFTRDLEADLKEFDPTNTLISVDGFYIRGSGRIDDVALLSAETTPTPIHISADIAIERWLKKENLVETKKKQRAQNRLILGTHKVKNQNGKLIDIPHSDMTLMLDISDLEQIKEIAREYDDQYNYPIKYSIRENAFIMIYKKQTLIFHDYKTGKLISKTNLTESPLGVDYLLIMRKDNQVAYIDKISNSLKAINFTNKTQPNIRTLYEGDSYTRYATSSSGSRIKIAVKDNNGVKIKDIYLTNDHNTNIQNAVNHFAKLSIGVNATIRLKRVNQEKTRAVGVYIKNNYSSMLYIMDISDLNNIKVLNKMKIDNFFHHLNDVIFKNKTDIIVITNQELYIFNYNTGREIYSIIFLTGKTIDKYIHVIDFTENYTIYSFAENNHTSIKRINYSDTSNPSISN